jgi:polyphosphate kinase 2 (PPK2 family)
MADKSKKVLRDELSRLQVELVKLQEWVRTSGLKIVVIFEGRDAAGKGGAIKRITEKTWRSDWMWWMTSPQKVHTSSTNRSFQCATASKKKRSDLPLC